MDIWNPTEEERKSPEWLRFHVHFLQSGAQQRRDWMFYPKHERSLSVYASYHWLWVLGVKGGRKDNFEPSWVKLESLYKKDTQPHYTIHGCNIHNRVEWVRYVAEEKEVSLEERLRKIFASGAKEG